MKPCHNCSFGRFLRFTRKGIIGLRQNYWIAEKISNSKVEGSII